MDQNISPSSGAVSATAEPSSSNSESRVNITVSSESSNSSNSTRDDEHSEGSNSNNAETSNRSNRNEGTGANVEETETQSDPYLRRRPQTLGEVMRELGSRAPDVMVLESMPEESSSRNREAALNPKEDLWMSTADG